MNSKSQQKKTPQKVEVNKRLVRMAKKLRKSKSKTEKFEKQIDIGRWESEGPTHKPEVPERDNP